MADIIPFLTFLWSDNASSFFFLSFTALHTPLSLRAKYELHVPSLHLKDFEAIAGPQGQGNHGDALERDWYGNGLAWDVKHEFEMSA